MANSADPTIIRVGDDEILVAHQRDAALNGIYRRTDIHVTYQGFDVGCCPVCGWGYDVVWEPDRVEVRVRCDCPKGAPDAVLGYALMVSAGLEPFTAEDEGPDAVPGSAIFGNARPPFIAAPPNSEPE